MRRPPSSTLFPYTTLFGEQYINRRMYSGQAKACPTGIAGMGGACFSLPSWLLPDCRVLDSELFQVSVVLTGVVVELLHLGAPEQRRARLTFWPHRRGWKQVSNVVSQQIRNSIGNGKP